MLPKLANVGSRYGMTVPNARRIVYSTCSVHKEEDEEVVAKGLESPEAIDNGWKIAPRSEVLPAWERRGRPEAVNGNKGELVPANGLADV